MRCNYGLIFAVLLSTSVMAQEMLLLPPGVSTLSTRDASEYLSLEQSLISFIGDKNNEENFLLADNFEIWLAKSNQWLPKDKWLETMRSQTNVRIRDLSVRYLDDLAIVSFFLETGVNDSGQQFTQSIVDVWRNSIKKLNVRYVIDVSEK